ncbi:PhoH family protein [Candidatus Dependentiae bacterium]|nr:PhoH family protein [Candidatus Dependentiae bacterium]
MPVSKSSKASNPLRKKRVFVLDTNVLLHDSNSLFSFKGVVIGIPFAVLEELDEFKKEQNELGMNARHVIRILDELRVKGDLIKGVTLENEPPSILRVLPIPKALTIKVCSKTIDNIIIQNTIDLVKAGYEVTFITKDINLRVKADALGIEAEDYTKGTVTHEDFYKGWQSISTSSIELKKMTEKKLPDFLGEHTLFANEFVILQSEKNEWNNRLFRYMGGNNFKEIFNQKFWRDFGPRNIQQAMALDLLLDDSVKLVFLSGPAGTGKTFLVLLAGLFKVIKEHLYRRFLISRPIVALGADIGFLPGDVQEKLFHWMQPVYDNLEIILSELDSATLGERAKERRHRRRSSERPDDRRRGQRPQDIAGEIDRLKQRGILSLEAITYMRGRSISNQYVFIDEAQNLTPHVIKTIVSRASEGTKMIVAGDPFQIDSPYLDFTSNGLIVSAEKLKQESICGTVFLETSERSDLAKMAADLL